MQNRVRPTMDLGGTPVNDDATLEREADVMGARALAAGRGAAQLRTAASPAPGNPDGSEPVQRAAEGGASFALHPAEPSSARFTRAPAAAAAPLQRMKIDYGTGAEEKYGSIVKALKRNPAVAGLIERVLAGGDVKLSIDKDEDTRYDRSTRTIYVGRDKEKHQARAAILFELNNAANPHTYTDAAEGVLTTMNASVDKLGGGDYLHVAREMEKDEFISLVNYVHQAEALGAGKQASRALREKYVDLLIEGGRLSYDSYVEQNRTSDHTLELAMAQHKEFTGPRGPSFPAIPRRYGDRAHYVAHQSGTGSARAGLRSSTRGPAPADTLAEEAELYPVDARFTAAAPAWDPDAIQADYHQPLARPAALPAAAAAAPAAASSSHASSGVRRRRPGGTAATSAASAAVSSSGAGGLGSMDDDFDWYAALRDDGGSASNLSDFDPVDEGSLEMAAGKRYSAAEAGRDQNRSLYDYLMLRGDLPFPDTAGSPFAQTADSSMDLRPPPAAGLGASQGGLDLSIPAHRRAGKASHGTKRKSEGNADAAAPTVAAPAAVAVAPAAGTGAADEQSSDHSTRARSEG
jgi:hypothetical protein